MEFPSTLTSAAMLLDWLPNSQNGLMVGDYIATAFTNGVPHGVFAVAQVNSGDDIRRGHLHGARPDGCVIWKAAFIGGRQASAQAVGRN